VVDTHLHARYQKHIHHAFRSHRAGQIVQLAMDLAGLRQPLIVAGDFNFSERESGHAVLTGLTRLRDTAAEAGEPQPTIFAGNPYRGPRKRSKRVDYVFVRDGAERAVKTRSVERVFAENLEGLPRGYSNHAGVMAEVEISHGAVSQAPVPDPRAIELAADLLSQGRDDAERRQQGVRTWAGAGLGCAVVAAAGTRSRPLSRRRLLRHMLHGATFAALAPGVGFSILSEVFVPDELAAFQRLADRLAKLDGAALDTTLA
jgi:hypothetical protein